MEYYNAQELLSFLEENLKENILEIRLESRKAGIKQEEFHNIWLEVKREKFRGTVKLLMSLQYPHIAIISGHDTGETIELVYLFSLFYGEKFKEISINVKVRLERKNPAIESITDLIPGAQTTEREIKEMLGVEFIGLPDMRNIFLPYDFPKNVFPFRKDQKGLDELVPKES
ncbi:MAG: NADH-quinone oxidoreductase subunit C [Atribacterota bacterium]|jgi:membrane-bound hydrogenase subunit beta|nr:NADH-quinone oxidoreductase subunit C [Atribacterota bacterium]MDD4895286.1 NADH-quinone oxidoreductase subunit C [Atribacterota bacterium]MDD5636610.1 NADH-quinone oxidoreductase subunit C [Atribacterota bacterium]